jgi:hypothetical protein
VLHEGVKTTFWAPRWEERTYYVVDASFNENNPTYRAIFYSGFLNGENGDLGDMRIVQSNL